MLLLGACGVGKSSLLERLRGTSPGPFDASYDVTIGVEYGSCVVQLPEGRTAELQVWDTSGRETMSLANTAYYSGVHGSVYVFLLFSQSMRRFRARV